MFEILVSFLGILFLIILHEFSHFLAAKKSGVKVLEFGIFLPPAIFKKKVGETVYSLNLIPLGGFVKLEGEEKESEDPRSFSKASLSKRILIVLAGVISFWIICAILFSVIFSLGMEFFVSDTDFAKNPKIKVLHVLENSPAKEAQILPKDYILRAKFEEKFFEFKKVKELREFSEAHKGKEVLFLIQRGNQVLEKKVVLRESYPEGEGPLGVIISRVDFKKYPFYLAPFYGIKETLVLTKKVVAGYFLAAKNLISKKETHMQLVGPVGIFYFGKKAFEEGPLFYLYFLVQISVFLAIFNALPLPGLDGGKFLFLAIEGIFKKKVKESLQMKIEGAFLIFLLFLVFLATISDIKMIFLK